MRRTTSSAFNIDAIYRHLDILKSAAKAVRKRLPAGGRWMRTFGPSSEGSGVFSFRETRRPELLDDFSSASLKPEVSGEAGSVRASISRTVKTSGRQIKDEALKPKLI